MSLYDAQIHALNACRNLAAMAHEGESEARRVTIIAQLDQARRSLLAATNAPPDDERPTE